MGYPPSFRPLQPSQQASPAWTQTQGTGAHTSVQASCKFRNLTAQAHLWQQNNIPWTSRLSADGTLLGEAMNITLSTIFGAAHWIYNWGKTWAKVLGTWDQEFERPKRRRNMIAPSSHKKTSFFRSFYPWFKVKCKSEGNRRWLVALKSISYFPYYLFTKLLSLKLLLALTLGSKQIFPWLSEKEVWGLFGIITTKTTKWNKTRKPEASHSVTVSLSPLFQASSHCFSCAVVHTT